jgi:hypothetical protein
VRRAEEREAYHEALEILASLVELLPAGDPRWREVVAALSWRAQWVVDHRADAHALLGVGPMRRIDAVLAGLPAPAERAVVKFRLASFLAWGAGELAEAAVECRRAGELFTEAGDRGSALLAEHELAWIGALAGDLGGLGDTAPGSPPRPPPRGTGRCCSAPPAASSWSSRTRVASRPATPGWPRRSRWPGPPATATRRSSAGAAGPSG